MPGRTARFQFGVEVLASRPPRWLRGARVGLVCHPASVDRRLVHSADALRAVFGKRLVALFGPQHGARGEKQDNMIESADFRDPRSGLPVYSLYGAVREPTDSMLTGLDVLLVDLQDVGTRVYTFVSTMVGCLRAAARTGRKIVILDRPNPIGGIQVEGHVRDDSCRSFVGELAIPMRHGMTIGELARWANQELSLNGALEVVAMRGWRRDYYWDDLGVDWVAPSPNMPTLDTALCYPGSVLFEGTNVSEGRGTTQPFQLIGAPFIEPDRLIEAVSAKGLRGVHLRAAWFEPTFHKWAGQLCGGVQIHVLDRSRFEPYRTGLTLLHAIRRLWPDEFAWKQPPYEYEWERMPIDLIAGTPKVREWSRARVAGLDRVDRAALTGFQKRARRYFLYDAI